MIRFRGRPIFSRNTRRQPALANPAGARYSEEAVKKYTQRSSLVSDPLVHLLKRVRKAHKLSQANVEKCMELAQGAYRHIERGRRKLPDFQHDLVAWVRTFENCVGASREERQQILKEMSHHILEQLEVLLRDLEQNG
jgi:DNA-binding XRE family transcriptional regulator